MFNPLNPRIVTQAPNHIFLHNNNTRVLEILTSTSKLGKLHPPRATTSREKSLPHLDVEAATLKEERRGDFRFKWKGKGENKKKMKRAWGLREILRFVELMEEKMERVFGGCYLWV